MKINKPSIFVIIITYNGSKWIDKCFGSLINSTIPIKILAIDNASSDGTPDIIRKKFPEVEVIETGSNLGFGAANNMGIKKALNEGADFLFLLNQDAWLENDDTIEKLVDIAQHNTDYGIISPIHLNGKGDLLDKNFGTYLYQLGGRKFITDKVCNRQTEMLVDLEFVNAAAWLMTKELISKVGFFDPVFFHYGEDSNYVKRVQYHSFKIGVAPEAYIHHDREGNTNALLKDDFESFLRLKKILWADVNLELETIKKNIDITLKDKKMSVIKSLMKLDLKGAKNNFSQIKELKKNAEWCIKSHKNNC